MSTAYLSGNYLPPIPVLAVRFLRLAELSSATDIYSAIVDTGADMTVAPADILRDLQAQAVQETNLVSQWGDRHPVVLYLVDVEVDGHRFPGVLVAGDEDAGEIILGRNLLNMLPLLLDGPRQQTRLLDGAQIRHLRD